MLPKDRTTVISPSNVLQLPRYNRSYSVIVAAVGGTITKFSLQTNGASCYLTLFVNDRALPGATNIPVSATLSQINLKEKVRTNDAITLIINSTPTYYPPEGSTGPSAKRRQRHHHHHHVIPTEPPPVVANLSYTLWIEQ
jgi:hypothetical protein